MKEFLCSKTWAQFLKSCLFSCTRFYSGSNELNGLFLPLLNCLLAKQYSRQVVLEQPAASIGRRNYRQWLTQGDARLDGSTGKFTKTRVP